MASPSSQPVGLLAINVDYFDVVVASHGFSVAQEIMAIVAERLDEVTRPSDVVARYSEDGYALLCASNNTSAELSDLARHIWAQFHEPVMTSVGQLPVTTSVGIATAAGQSAATSPRVLLRQAQSAVTNAQQNGRSHLAVFDDEIQRLAIENYEIEQQLRAALDQEAIDVAYQPVVSLHSGEVVGIEALARWHHDSLGDVSPHTFIPIAEGSGLIGRLGQTVLEQAIDQGEKWQQDGKGVWLSLNLTNRQLLDPQLVPMISELLTASKLGPRRLCVEISESVVMSDVATSMTILCMLKDLGVSLAIDDFGTGYSSLSYLHRLPVDILKIDQSFVQGIYNRDDRVITKAIIDLAHTLGMTTIAQGVETHLQAEVLHALNCDMAQGFYLHPPADGDVVEFTPINFESSGFSENLGSPSAHAGSTPLSVRR